MGKISRGHFVEGGVGLVDATVAAADFFAPPSKDPARENVLAHDEILIEVHLPSAASKSLLSSYHNVVVSSAVALETDRLTKEATCRGAQVMLGGVAPVPWMLAGKCITADLAAQAGQRAVKGAQPLAKNIYKIPLTAAILKRTLASLGSA